MTVVRDGVNGGGGGGSKCVVVVSTAVMLMVIVVMVLMTMASMLCFDGWNVVYGGVACAGGVGSCVEVVLWMLETVREKVGATHPITAASGVQTLSSATPVCIITNSTTVKGFLLG